ncbi:MAG: thioredoxin-disulfide reductase [Myxococcota bacterium]
MTPQIVMYTKSWCPYCDRAKELLRSKGVEWDEIDVESSPERLEEMLERGGGRRTVPQIFVGDIHVGGSDELAALEREGKLDVLIGRDPGQESTLAVERVSVLIIGSGPAGYTAGIYAARAELEPVLIAGRSFGGQLMLTTDVENYPGFPEGVTGPEMMELFEKQAERFGTRILKLDATAIDLGVHPFQVEAENLRFEADTLIIGTGASARWMGLPSEERLRDIGGGVSACATCDGALFRGKPLAVVGGGDTAMEEALFLTRFASAVHVVHRRDELRASKIMRDRALRNDKIKFVWSSVVEEVLGDKTVTGVRLEHVETGETSELAVEGVFVAIGHTPNTGLFKPWVRTNDQGYILVEAGSTRTNVEGVFACGDAMDPSYRQAVTAAGTGCMAALDAERWIAARE